MKPRFCAQVLVLSLLIVSGSAVAGPILYGGNGGHGQNPIAPSTNDGWLVTVDQTTGAITPVGHPDSVARITGLSFDSTGALWATTAVTGGFPPPPGPTSSSNLIRINPFTGAQLSSVPVTAAGLAIAIADLAIQPGTNTIFGVRSPIDQTNGQGTLYTINPTTGVATAVNPAAATHFFGSIAFAPNGKFYEISADLDAMGNVVNPLLSVLDPSTGATLSSGALKEYYGAFGVRPTDGLIFAGNGDQGQIYSIDPVTRTETLLNAAANNQFPGDLAFAPIPEPGTLALFGLGLLAITLTKRRRV